METASSDGMAFFLDSRFPSNSSECCSLARHRDAGDGGGCDDDD